MSDDRGVEVTVRELAPGEHEVTHQGGTARVLVPAGVGIPGVAEEDLVALLAELLLERGELPDVVDVSLLLGTRPGLVDELVRRADERL
jgi:hypothetical protein